MWSLIAFVLLPAIVLGQQCSVQGDCKGFSVDFDYFDSERECLAHCNSVEGCEWYMYDSSDKFCNSLRDCDEVDSTCTTCIHGENECQLPLMCFVPVECHGEYIDHVDVATAEVCLERCHNDYMDCKYFSFLTDIKICNILGSCILDGNQTEVVSGERDCYGNGPGHSTKIFLQSETDTAWVHTPSVLESGNTTSCSALPDYPLDGVVGVEVQIVFGSITTCGGWSPLVECFSLDSTLNIWVEFPSLNLARGYAASVMAPDGWWITGGGDSTAIMSSSEIFNGSNWNEGPDLPSPRRIHCMAKVNETHFFLAGGYASASELLSDAYLFVWTTQEWIQLPDIESENYALACAHFRDATLGPMVLAAGGHGNLRNVEALSLDTLEWLSFPDLPIDSSYGDLLLDGRGMVLANHRFGNLLRFSPGNRTFSVIQGQTLPFTGFGVAAIEVGDEQLFGCN